MTYFFLSILVKIGYYDRQKRKKEKENQRNHLFLFLFLLLLLEKLQLSE